QAFSFPKAHPSSANPSPSSVCCPSQSRSGSGRRSEVKRRMLRALSLAGRSIGFLSVVVGSLALGVHLHAKTPAFRRLAASVGNQVMGNLFEGTIVVDGVESLSIGRRATVQLRRVEITDPDGKRVIVAEGVRASIDLYDLFDDRSSGRGPLVEVSDVE